MDSGEPLQLLLIIAAIFGGVLAAGLSTACESSFLAFQVSSRRRHSDDSQNDILEFLLGEQDRLVLSLRAFNYCSKVMLVLALGIFCSSVFFPDHLVMGYLLGVCAALPVIIILTDIAPKSFADRSTFHVASFLAPFGWVITKFMTPFVFPHLLLNRRLTRLSLLDVDSDRIEIESEVSEMELRAMLSVGEIKGVIEEDTRDIIEGIFSLGDLQVTEIMTMRDEVVCLDFADLSSGDLIDYLRTSDYSRILIFENDLDHVRGYVDRRFVLLNPELELCDYIRKALFVSSSCGLLEILGDMKRARIHFAVVLDEYSGTAGIVTMEDLLNEIVGELEDDSNRGAEIRQISDLTYSVSGRLELEDLNDELELDLSFADVHTVSGVIMTELGHSPSVGDVLVIENLSLTVLRMGARRVARAKLEILSVVDDFNGEGFS